MKMKKVVSSLLVLAVGVSLMTGCGRGKEGSAVEDDSRIQIKVQ